MLNITNLIISYLMKILTAIFNSTFTTIKRRISFRKMSSDFVLLYLEKRGSVQISLCWRNIISQVINIEHRKAVCAKWLYGTDCAISLRSDVPFSVQPYGRVYYVIVSIIHFPCFIV